MMKSFLAAVGAIIMTTVLNDHSAGACQGGSRGKSKKGESKKLNSNYYSLKKHQNSLKSTMCLYNFQFLVAGVAGVPGPNVPLPVEQLHMKGPDIAVTRHLAAEDNIVQDRQLSQKIVAMILVMVRNTVFVKIISTFFKSHFIYAWCVAYIHFLLPLDTKPLWAGPLRRNSTKINCRNCCWNRITQQMSEPTKIR